MSESILEVSNLTKDFGGVRALNNVDLTVGRGELLGVIGPNGSGKTTLVNLVSGFVKPTAGRVVFQGKNITGWPPHRVADLGLVRTFQMVRPFYKLAAFKNMIVPLTSHRVRRQVGGKYGDRKAVAKDLLEEVGFERDSAVILKTASELPHGYLKRIELARCIALEADLIILDELFSGLSLAEVATIVPVIEKLRVQGRTIIMIEHRLKELFRIADRVAVLNFGEKIAEGQPESVMEDEAVKSAYLGSKVEQE
jgi:ABC-type branched-subunit amino acid transport system ATPase component